MTKEVKLQLRAWVQLDFKILLGYSNFSWWVHMYRKAKLICF